MEALNANLGPLDERLHKARGFNGAQESAKMLRALVQGGSLALKKKKVRCQDAYSLRSTPQVIGAAHDAFIHAREQVGLVQTFQDLFNRLHACGNEMVI